MSIVIVQKRVLRCDCCLSEIDDAVVTKVYNGVRSDMCSDCQAQGYVLSDDLRFSRDYLVMWYNLSNPLRRRWTPDGVDSAR